MNRHYAPAGQALGDFWLYEENGTYHLYYLQAPLSAAPALRPRLMTVGYAVSQDLIHWQEQGTVLSASEHPEAWDSVSIWTGCTLKKDGVYYMFYTSRCQNDIWVDGYAGHTQRIGLATSTDLRHWERYSGNPLITADPRYYEQQPDAYNKHEGCRDPFVIQEEETGIYYMFFTARDREGEPKSRGCIGRAKSMDLLHWEVLPPAASPHTFTDMEVPSLHRHNGKWYMMFAVKADWYTQAYRQQIAPLTPQTGELYFVADSLAGEFVPMDDDPVISGTDNQLYTGRIMKDPSGQDVFLAWNAGPAEGFDPGNDPYTLSLPRPVLYDAKGKMTLSHKEE